MNFYSRCCEDSVDCHQKFETPHLFTYGRCQQLFLIRRRHLHGL